MILKIKKLDSAAVIPRYVHADDSGMDICSIEEKIIGCGEITLVRTGLQIELPPGTEAQIRPRSGLALKHGITLLNTPGTIDEGYRGEIAVIMINHGNKPFSVEKGMRIAQMVICPVIRVKVEASDELNNTSRGENGFGSTGVK